MLPLRVAIVDPQELVVAGVTTMLSRFPDRVTFVTSEGEADAVLYGMDDQVVVSHDQRLHDLLRRSSATVITFGLRAESPNALLAAACGVHGFAHQQMTAEQLVDRMELLHDAKERDGHPELPSDGQCHPEVEIAGLSRREIEVLSMIARGMSNREIAEGLYVSINTVKTYVRTTYQKIDVQRRSQAVLWATQHGLGAAPGDAAEVLPLLREG